MSAVAIAEIIIGCIALVIVIMAIAVFILVSVTNVVVGSACVTGIGSFSRHMLRSLDLSRWLSFALKLSRATN